MIRRIIEINEEKCNGCGLCATACHENAIGMKDGKAILLRDDYCDGLGDCLPTCPTGAIAFVEREALEYDDAAVKANQKKLAESAKAAEVSDKGGADMNAEYRVSPSELTHWPVQIQLAPIEAPYFEGADLLIAADCTAFSYGDFHQKFMKDKITLIGCTKLDSVNYSEKLTEIIKRNNIKSVTVVRMIVPCCGGMAYAVETALKESGKDIPYECVILTLDGEVKG
ncbi:MAG: 4Fe-4S binding protein [Eubacteriales bacterium]